MRFKLPLNKIYVTSKFGYRDSPYPDEQGTLNYHNGLDLRAAIGDPVYSVAAGTVLNTYWGDKGGNQIVIEHKNGYRSGYAHLSLIGVEAGQKVKAGDQIGEAGNTGGFDGMYPHLHLTLKKDNKYIDPEQIIDARGSLAGAGILALIILSGLYFMNK